MPLLRHLVSRIEIGPKANKGQGIAALTLVGTVPRILGLLNGEAPDRVIQVVAPG